MATLTSVYSSCGLLDWQPCFRQRRRKGKLNWGCALYNMGWLTGLDLQQCWWSLTLPVLWGQRTLSCSLAPSTVLLRMWRRWSLSPFLLLCLTGSVKCRSPSALSGCPALRWTNWPLVQAAGSVDAGRGWRAEGGGPGGCLTQHEPGLHFSGRKTDNELKTLWSTRLWGSCALLFNCLDGHYSSRKKGAGFWTPHSSHFNSV